LGEKAGAVTAVELDNKLADLLRISLKKQKIENVQVMNGNALDLMTGEGNYKIVANLPYNITSAFLRKFVSQAKHKPELMVLLLQREVAERISAKPGEMSLLAVSVQAYATAELINTVPANAFYPAPKVESAIIRIRIKSSVIPAQAGIHGLHNNNLDPRFHEDDKVEKAFFQLVRIGFSARRKKLANNLSAGFHITQKEATNWLARAGFDENTRAQELSVDDWITLLRVKSIQ
jgi:16S rRNA (adenine1518-N6/adenine1519-N6)-dimethyltransferase